MSQRNDRAAMAEDRVDPRISGSRRRVLTAALEEMAEVGYGGFTIESVCRRSAVAKSTLYRHWPGKLPLVADALRTLNVQPGPTSSDGESTADPTPRKRVVRLVDHLARAFSGSPVADCTPALIDAADRDEELRDLFHRYTAERRRPLEDALRDAVDAGEAPGDLRPELAAVALAGAVMYRRLMTPHPLEPAEAEALVATVLGAAPRPS